jgi:hypothetical protein
LAQDFVCQTLFVDRHISPDEYRAIISSQQLSFFHHEVAYESNDNTHEEVLVTIITIAIISIFIICIIIINVLIAAITVTLWFNADTFVAVAQPQQED